MPDTLINDDLDAWDRASLLHPTTHIAQHQRGELAGRIVTGGEGAWITDRDGRRFLDGFAALYCVNVGYGQQALVDAANAAKSARAAAKSARSASSRSSISSSSCSIRAVYVALKMSSKLSIKRSLTVIPSGVG